MDQSDNNVINMRTQVFAVKQAESKGWNEMVASHPLGSAFLHTAFLRVISETFTHTEPYCVCLLDPSGKCCAGLATFLVKSWLTGRRLVSIPFAFYADPLVRSTEEFEALFREVVQLSQQERTSYVEIKARSSSSLLAGANLMTPTYYQKTYYLDISAGLDTLWTGFHRSSVRQKIRRAERNAIEVRAAEAEGEIMSFHQLLSRHRRRLGLPPQRTDYFRNIWKYLVPLKLAQFWLARQHDRLIGGLCAFTFRDTVFLGYIGMEQAFQPDGVGQSLIWKAICDASQRGLRIVDFGKASSHADGQIHYKKNWGAAELDTPVFYYPRVTGVSSYDNQQNLSYRLIQLFWRTLPVGLSPMAARFFYRHVG